MPILLFPCTVREQVLEQHAELRPLLNEAVSLCEGASERDAGRLFELARAIHLRFRAHLAYEDDALQPVLAVLDSWGPERVRSLYEDHLRQRRSLDGLLATFQVQGDVARLAGALRRLAQDLLDDMVDEEQGCLSAPQMSAEILTIERR
ncbi:MAG TPA: hemerythrin domain-containing protein [Polyangia bacterium]|jgi:hypothetical protein|nr:hemerythrin domain-containing protein [Polyangia bacterium]